jgi:hypothetical protein
VNYLAKLMDEFRPVGEILLVLQHLYSFTESDQIYIQAIYGHYVG